MYNKIVIRTHVTQTREFKIPTWKGSISVWENGKRSWGEFSKITRLTPEDARLDAINMKKDLLERSSF